MNNFEHWKAQASKPHASMQVKDVVLAWEEEREYLIDLARKDRNAALVLMEKNIEAYRQIDALESQLKRFAQLSQYLDMNTPKTPEA